MSTEPNVSFGAGQRPTAAPAPEVDESDSPAASSLVVQQGTLGKVTGEVNRRDIIIPSLKIVQGVGPLSENFSPGQIVLNNEIAISDGSEPVTLTVLAIKKSYIENVEYGSEQQPRRFATEAEVKEAGLWTEWINNQKPPAAEVAEALVAVESKEENPLYPFSRETADGVVHYSLAVWTLRGVSYSRAAKVIFTAAQFSLREGLYKGSWSLSTKREKIGKNVIAVPVLKRAGNNDQETQEFLLQLV